jgi:hypothetical protein
MRHCFGYLCGRRPRSYLEGAVEAYSSVGSLTANSYGAMEVRMNYLRRFVVQLLVFGGIPIAIAFDWDVSPLHLVALTVVTVIFALAGWVMQPVLKHEVSVRRKMWLVPPVVLAGMSLLTREPVFLGPFLVYLTASSFRATGFNMHSIKHKGLREWSKLVAGVVPIMGLVAFFACFSSIFGWSIQKAFFYLLSKP